MRQNTKQVLYYRLKKSFVWYRSSQTITPWSYIFFWAFPPTSWIISQLQYQSKYLFFSPQKHLTGGKMQLLHTKWIKQTETDVSPSNCSYFFADSIADPWFPPAAPQHLAAPMLRTHCCGSTQPCKHYLMQYSIHLVLFFQRPRGEDAISSTNKG